MSDGLTELPVGWKWTDLGIISEIIMGQSPPGDSYNQSGIGTPLVNGPVEFGPDPFSKTVKSKFTTSPTKFCKTDDLILCVRGSTTGRMNIAGFDACIGRGVAAIRSYADQNYLNVFIDSQREDIYRLGTGSTFPNVSAEVLSKIDVPLPPLNEQKRIVAKIEELRDRSHRAKQALEAIPELCDRFCQSVLAAAFRGDLTADWREENPDVEPASVLLKQFTAKKQGSSKSRFKDCDLSSLEGDKLAELPQGWCWATFEQISERVTVGHVGSMKDEYVPEGIPFLRSQNVRENRFDPTGLQFISNAFHEKLNKSSLQPGDLVVVRSGSVGTACVIPDELKEANCSDLVIVKQPTVVHPHYGSYYMNSVARSHVNEKQVGVALTHFNTKSMAQMPIPVAPYPEQEEIILRVQKLFKSIELIEEKYNASETELSYLNQAILAKAFRGELVEQDPNDEPASVLLDRIQAERQAQEDKKSRGTRGKRKKASGDQMDLPGIE